MKEKFPHEIGLQDVGKSDTETFEEEDRNFVQILNCYNTHWICLTNIDCKSNEVKVCIGQYVHWQYPMNTKEVVTSLVNLSQRYLYLALTDVQ